MNLSYNLEVSNNYDGPHLDGEITMDFMVELIKTFKDQKKLDAKYSD